MTTVRSGPKEQIVIPAEVREMFGIEPGRPTAAGTDTGSGHRPAAQNAAGQIFAAITAAMPKKG